MKKLTFLLSFLFVLIKTDAQIADINTYLKSTTLELQKTWPNNKTMNMVFHGHSVVAGYFLTPTVNTLLAYPHLTLINLKDLYPNAVINVITTAIGGENSEQGQLRFESEVLTKRPDVLFIDYAINDRGIGLIRARAAWVKMIEAAIKYRCKIMLLTPTPVSNETITNNHSPLALQAAQIRELAAIYHVGLVDNFKVFQNMTIAGTDLTSYYAQPVHVNEKGHKIVGDEIKKWFINIK
jgi:acyl-CoA thioesterase I